MASDDRSPSRRWSTLARSAGGLLVVGALLLWLVMIIDALAGGALSQYGIRPRRSDGVVGIATAPLLHSGWDHLVANTGVYLVLGALVAIRGRRYLLVTALAAMVVGGGLTWLLGGSGNHIGASGVVFGFFGALVGAAFFERRLAAIGPALIVALFYNSMVVGFVPQAGVSWEGHAFGAIGGLWAAWVMRVRRSPPRELTDEEIGFDWRG